MELGQSCFDARLRSLYLAAPFPAIVARIFIFGFSFDSRGSFLFLFDSTFVYSRSENIRKSRLHCRFFMQKFTSIESRILLCYLRRIVSSPVALKNLTLQSIRDRSLNLSPHEFLSKIEWFRKLVFHSVF